MTDHISLPRSTVEAAYSLHGYAQGTREAVAFNQGARWHAALAGAAQAEPLCHVYEWDLLGGGVRRSTDHTHWNGVKPARSIPVYTAAQPAQPVAVPQELLQAIDDYAETRHKCGDWTYNAKTSAAREKLRAMLNAAPTPPAATVPVLEPLTDAEIEAIWVEVGLDDCDPVGFARAVEAAHAAKLAKLNGITPPAEESAS